MPTAQSFPFSPASAEHGATKNTIEPGVRFGCIFCGHRQNHDALCGACRRDRTLDLTDSGVRDLFRDTEMRAREKREATAKMFGAIAGMLTLVACVAVQIHLGILRRIFLLSTFALTVLAAFSVTALVEEWLDRKLFPWFDSLS